LKQQQTTQTEEKKRIMNKAQIRQRQQQVRMESAALGNEIFDAGNRCEAIMLLGIARKECGKRDVSKEVKGIRQHLNASKLSLSEIKTTDSELHELVKRGLEAEKSPKVIWMRRLTTLWSRISNLIKKFSPSPAGELRTV